MRVGSDVTLQYEQYSTAQGPCSNLVCGPERAPGSLNADAACAWHVFMSLRLSVPLILRPPRLACTVGGPNGVDDRDEGTCP